MTIRKRWFCRPPRHDCVATHADADEFMPRTSAARTNYRFLDEFGDGPRCRRAATAMDLWHQFQIDYARDCAALLRGSQSQEASESFAPVPQKPSAPPAPSAPRVLPVHTRSAQLRPTPTRPRPPQNTECDFKGADLHALVSSILSSLENTVITPHPPQHSSSGVTQWWWSRDESITLCCARLFCRVLLVFLGRFPFFLAVSVLFRAKCDWVNCWRIMCTVSTPQIWQKMHFCKTRRRSNHHRSRRRPKPPSCSTTRLALLVYLTHWLRWTSRPLASNALYKRSWWPSHNCRQRC
jgi:hypothetical protein